jgi:hypothetical protein
MRSRLFIGILILVNVSLAGYVVAHRYIFAKPKLVPVAQSHVLPLVELRDDNGRVFGTNRFIGSPLFVQVINPHVEAEIASFLNVRNNRPKKSISWMLLTANAQELRMRLPSDSDDVVIVEEDYQVLRNLFSISKSREHWVIFDESGKYRSNGSYDTGDAANQLRNVADNEPIYSTKILSQMLTLMNEEGLLSQFHASAAHSASGKALVGMFSTACTACSDGSLVDLLDNHSAKDRRTSYLIILPNTFTKDDLKNFETNLELSIPVHLADADFTRQWSALNQQYGEKAINGSVFVVDKEKVVSVVSGLKETKRLLKELTE